MTVDRLSLPRLAQYLDALPQGIASYPSVTTKSDFSLILRERLAPVLAEAKLTTSLRHLLSEPWKNGEWIPSTVYSALCTIARDQLWTTEEDYHRGMLDVALEMYKGPLYRALFVMFGPSLVAMSAPKRWHTLHQGTELVMKKQNKQDANMILSYPRWLFPETAVQSLGAAFCAVAQGSRGKDPSFELVSFGETSSEVIIRWAY